MLHKLLHVAIRFATKVCPYCGALIMPGMKTCPHCGAPVEEG